MSNYRGHLGGGLVVYGLSLTALYQLQPTRQPHPGELILWLAMALLGSLFPDIDVWSKGQKLWYQGIFIFFSIALYLQHWYLLVGLSVAAIFPLFLRHRGLAHRIWFNLVAPLIGPFTVYLYNKNFFEPALECYLFFIAGALSHLALDFGPKKMLLRRKQRYRRYRS